jgi:hypothetical protein
MPQIPPADGAERLAGGRAWGSPGPHGGTGREAWHIGWRERGASAPARGRAEMFPARTGESGREVSVFCQLGGLAEQVVQFGLDVDMVTLIARRHNLIRAAEEVRDLLDGSLKVRLAER